MLAMSDEELDDLHLAKVDVLHRQLFRVELHLEHLVNR